MSGDPPAKTVLRANLRRLLRARVWVTERFAPTAWQGTLLWAALVGAVGAVGALGFRFLTEELIQDVTGSSAGVVQAFRSIPWWARVALPTAGGLLAGVAIWLGRRWAHEDTPTDYMEAIALGTGEVNGRSSMVKVGAGLLSIGGGASIGREGPMVQMAALVASLVGRWRRFAAPQLRLLVACGAAAGITSAYNAPIAGALFVSEIILGSIAMGSLGPLVVASVAASITMRELTDVHALYQVPGFTLHSDWEMIPYLGLGVLAGLVAPAFLRSLRWSERVFTAPPWRPYLRLGAGGLIVGLLAAEVPEVAGNGYSVVLSILHGGFAWRAVVLILACKWLATSSSFGSGAPGGVFTPSLFVGASLGYLYGSLVQTLWPLGAADPRAFALVGMAAFLSAATHAPVMAVIMLFEMTLSYDIILPLLTCTVLGYFVSRGLESKPMYAEAFERELAAHPRMARIEELMKTDPPSVTVTTPFSDVARLFLSLRVNNIYVVDDGGQFIGVIALHDLKPTLHETRLASLVIAGDIVERDFPRILDEESLAEARARFVGVQAERLPVVAADGRLRGSLSKTDLFLALEDHLRGLASGTARDSESGAIRPAASRAARTE